MAAPTCSEGGRAIARYQVLLKVLLCARPGTLPRLSVENTTVPGCSSGAACPRQMVKNKIQTEKCHAHKEIPLPSIAMIESR